MIPTFPQSKCLELSDKDDVDFFTHAFDPYSDTNFAGLWTYDVAGRVRLSRLHDNLVVQTQDYTSPHMFYTFLGKNAVSQTISTLLSAAREQAIVPYLRMVPADCVQELLSSDEFIFEEDRDNFDYIISASKFGQLLGGDYHKKRNMVNRFIRDYGPECAFVPLDIHSPATQARMLEIFQLWEEIFGKKHEETLHELQALKRAFASARQLNLLSLGIMVRGELVAFLVAEKVQRSYAVRHFEKADVRFHGIVEYFQREAALYFQSVGCQWINYEQDLGIPGLREAKLLCHPDYFLKKYIIKWPTGDDSADKRRA